MHDTNTVLDEDENKAVCLLLILIVACCVSVDNQSILNMKQCKQCTLKQYRKAVINSNESDDEVAKLLNPSSP